MLKRLLLCTALLLFACTTLYAQPANDSCINAIPLTVTTGMCNSISYTNVLATNTPDEPLTAPPCWNPNTMSHTVWFTFVPDSSSVHISTNFNYSLTNTQIAVYSGTCGALSLIACQEDIYAFNGFFHTDIIVNGLTPSTTYYIMIDGNGTNTGTFGVCVENIGSPGPVLPSEDCFSSVYLCDTSTISFAVNTATSGTIAESPGCFFGAPDEGAHWFQFTPISSGNLYFTITPNGNADYDFAFFDVTTGCPGFELSCNANAAAAVVTGLGCGGPDCNPPFFVNAGTTYAILVSRFTPGAIGFTLDFSGTSAAFGGVPIPTFSHPDSFCVGQAVPFTNQSPTQNSNLSFSWNFGDGNTSTAANPTHIYTSPTDTVVTLVASCGSGSNISQSPIHILPGLPASVTPAVSTICNGDSVMLIGSAVYDTTLLVPKTFTNDTNFAIADFATIQSDIIISGVNPNSFSTNPAISVCLNINHTWDADLQIQLVAPDGSFMYLSFGNGFGANFTGTCFTPIAFTPIGAGFPPFTGDFLPDDLFSNLNSTTINGTWSLIIYDSQFGDIGSLLDWSITFNAQNYLTYSWTPTSGLTLPANDSTYAMPTSSTNYTFVATDATGCPGSATSLVNVTNTPSSAFNISNTVFCTGEVATITFTGNVSSNAIFNWNFGTGDTISGSGAGPYLITWATGGTDSVTVYVQDSSCTSLTSVFYVTINQTPAAPTGTTSNSPVCEGSAINLSTDNVVGGSFNWTGPLGYNSSTQNPSIAGATVGMSGVYVVYTTVNNCPSPIATTFVSVIPTPVITAVAAPDSVCNEGILVLSTDTILGATYSWTGPSAFTSASQNPTINPVDFVNAGMYTVIATVGTCTGSSTVNVFVKPLPDSVVAISNSPICEGADTLQLYSDTFAVGLETYSWTGPNSYTSTAQNPFLTPTSYTQSGPYIVHRTVDGCDSHNQTVNVQIDQFIAAQLANNSVLVHTCMLDTTIVAIDPTPAFGTWSLLSGTGNIVSPNNYISLVTGIDTGGSIYRWLVVNGTCRDSIDLTVMHDGLDTCGQFEHNELITPNSDGLNERLIFTGLDKFPQNKLFVYNRWGSEVFSQDNYKNEWRGRRDVGSGGDELPDGTYYFVLTIQGKDPVKGFIEIRK